MTIKRKRIIVFSSLIVLIPILISGWYFLKMKSEISKMHTAETGVIIKDTLVCINDGTCDSYLVKTGDSYILFDAGSDIDIIKNEMQKLEINPEKVIAVFITHSDWDHVASIPLFKTASLFISKQEEQMINGETERALIFSNGIDRTDYKTLNDNETVLINDISVKGVLTPGHTPGSMCYIVNSKYLIIGDALSIENGKAVGFSDFFNMDSETALKSMEKLKNLDGVEIICTGHSGYTSYKSIF